MEEIDILDDEALNNSEKKYRRKRMITIAITAAFALAIIIVFVLIAKAYKTDKASAAPATVSTQETGGVTDTNESTTAPEIDISTNNAESTTPTKDEVVEPTKPENNTNTVTPTKPIEPSVPNTEESKPTQPENTPSEPPAAPERGEYPIDPPQTDRERLACVIYQEVGGDAYCDECRKRVADVVLNRVNDPRFPNTVEGVLLQSGQYGRFSWTGIVWQSRASNAGERHAVERAYRIADEILAGNHSSLYGNGYVWQAGFVQGRDNIYCCGHYFGR